jgi:hypothetical protein
MILILGVLILASPTAAKTTHIDQWAVGCVIAPGVDWVSDDGVLHGRGRLEAIVNYGFDEELGIAEIVGSGSVISSADIDLATGNGATWGLFSMIHLPLSTVGTFDGVWRVELAGWLFSHGDAEADGTGPLLRSKLRLSMLDEPVPLWLEEELALRPPPCGRENAVILHNLATVRGRPPR